jgi:ankyrin repeat protein
MAATAGTATGTIDEKVDRSFTEQNAILTSTSVKVVATNGSSDMEEGNGPDAKLWRAARDGHFSIVEEMLTSASTRLDRAWEPTSGGGTALHAAALHGRNDIYDFLVGHGWDPKHRSMAITAENLLHEESACTCAVA